MKKVKDLYERFLESYEYKYADYYCIMVYICIIFVWYKIFVIW